MEIRFTVEGWPPIKGEALSMFNRAHGQHERVKALLEAATAALQGSSWNRREERPIGLELIIREAPAQSMPADATNALGGVADVLQAWPANVDSSPYDGLCVTPLFANDAQIREVRYSVAVERGDAPCYRVRVWLLDSLPGASEGKGQP
ncbi:MAG: hypothetical protein OXK21_01985 [Chloroflexota bacterium]|nr:hypothetical protein [Chloroflexota bacterium]